MIVLIVYLLGYIPVWFFFRYFRQEFDGGDRWENVFNRVGLTIMWPLAIVPTIIIIVVDRFRGSKPPKWL